MLTTMLLFKVDFMAGDANSAAMYLHNRANKRNQEASVSNGLINVALRQLQYEMNKKQPFSRRLEIGFFDNNVLNDEENVTEELECCLLRSIGWGKTAIQETFRHTP